MYEYEAFVCIGMFLRFGTDIERIVHHRPTRLTEWHAACTLGTTLSFDFLEFALVAGMLDRVLTSRMREDAPDTEATKHRLSEGLGKAATFPTVEVAPGLYMSDSDRIIDYFAERHGLEPDEMLVL